jgi:hypothetical protein
MQSIGAQPSMPVPKKLQDFMQERGVNASPPNGSLELDGLEATPWSTEAASGEWQAAVRQLLVHYKAGTIPREKEFLDVLSAKDPQNQGLLHVAIAFQHLPSVVHLLRESGRDGGPSFLSSLATAKDRYEASGLYTWERGQPAAIPCNFILIACASLSSLGNGRIHTHSYGHSPLRCAAMDRPLVIPSDPSKTVYAPKRHIFLLLALMEVLAIIEREEIEKMTNAEVDESKRYLDEIMTSVGMQDEIFLLSLGQKAAVLFQLLLGGNPEDSLAPTKDDTLEEAVKSKHSLLQEAVTAVILHDAVSIKTRKAFFEMTPVDALFKVRLASHFCIISTAR